MASRRFASAILRSRRAERRAQMSELRSAVAAFTELLAGDSSSHVYRSARARANFRLGMAQWGSRERAPSGKALMRAALDEQTELSRANPSSHLEVAQWCWMAIALHRSLQAEELLDDATWLMWWTTESIAQTLAGRTVPRRTRWAVARLYRVYALDLQDRRDLEGAARAHATADSMR